MNKRREFARTRKPWNALAATVLRATIDYDYDTAKTTLIELHNQFPYDLDVIVLAWIDNTFYRIYGDSDAVGLVFTDEDTGITIGADGVDRAKRWAGRLCFARVRNDRDTIISLFGVFNSVDGYERGDLITALLNVCAATHRAAAAGTLPGQCAL